MEFRVGIDEEILLVEASPLDDTGMCTMTVNGESARLAVTAVSAHHVHLRALGNAQHVFAAPSDEGTWIWVEGCARLVKDADKEPRRTSRAPGSAPREITPPTPATVVRVLVETGDKVEKGQGVIVVSAMKMEMTLTAPYSGTVRAVNTCVGDQVSPGQILADIDPETEENGNE